MTFVPFVAASQTVGSSGWVSIENTICKDNVRTFNNYICIYITSVTIKNQLNNMVLSFVYISILNFKIYVI